MMKKKPIRLNLLFLKVNFFNYFVDLKKVEINERKTKEDKKKAKKK